MEFDRMTNCPFEGLLTTFWTEHRTNIAIKRLGADAVSKELISIALATNVLGEYSLEYMYMLLLLITLCLLGSRQVISQGIKIMFDTI
jgi:hypothetical protein